MIRVAEFQMLVEGISVLLGLHILSVGLHPGVGGVSCVAVVLRHKITLATERAVASVHCAAPGVRASLEARGTQPTLWEDASGQISSH